MEVFSTDRHRSEWSARYSVGISDTGPRAQGTLYQSGREVRRFDVKINDKGIFAPDIGTGSGVKVRFRHTAPQTAGAR